MKWFRSLCRIVWDWLVISSAGFLIALVWLGPQPPRWEQTIWLAVLISASVQLQCYRRWLDKSHERERWYRERWYRERSRW